MLFRFTLLIGVAAAGLGLSPFFIHWGGWNGTIPMDNGTARILLGCGTGLIATAWFFFKPKPLHPQSPPD